MHKLKLIKNGKKKIKKEQNILVIDPRTRSFLKNRVTEEDLAEFEEILSIRRQELSK